MDCQKTSDKLLEIQYRRKNCPPRLKDWFAEARQNAGGNKIPILAIHLAGDHPSEDLIILRRRDFESLLNPAQTNLLETRKRLRLDLTKRGGACAEKAPDLSDSPDNTTHREQ